ncbi:hypothetical protein Fcan01_14268 [Folsomia candida]|uniref:CRAL-TRIO domain-containing protein n=1 Tax=Folsomia candida TaxID=158441 RepID=A0A226E000_FOLCA|nr:hypothetical protein Fcan01_14268 [Folsomia candida]
MAKPSPHELEIIGEVRERISDLRLSDEYLQPKNLVRFVRARNEQLDQIEDMIRKGFLNMFKVFEANYPDTLRSAFIINEMPIFGTFWRLLRPIISDVTHAKISFLGSDKSLWAKSIGQLAKRDQFPEKYGGDQPPNYTVNLDEIGLNEFIFQNGNGEF